MLKNYEEKQYPKHTDYYSKALCIKKTVRIMQMELISKRLGQKKCNLREIDILSIKKNFLKKKLELREKEWKKVDQMYK